ncbi:cupin domain-containing protein [Spirillospora sp. NPDC048911]|uniref:cupin domain-containing protein n=1 Tax=Spirillospora sp. NPDC048911 TaxID=3364527 RepID=UPI003710EB7E
MTVRHIVSRAAEADFAVRADGYRVRSAVGEHAGAVHTGFEICELSPAGTLTAHMHSFEESFFMLEGAAVLTTPEGSTRLAPGDYGIVPVGVPHTWTNDNDVPCRWAQMQAPQPRSRYGDDTFPVPSPPATAPVPVDVRDPRTRRHGHIEPANMDPEKQSQDLLAVSASMRTALLVYSGITVKMMVDGDLGARLSTMFMVQYEPDGVAGPHDHPFEETYLILEGRTEAVLDGERHLLGPGDIAWAGAGCVHSFTNAGPGRVRWLETQAPQPPSRHSYRFARDWEPQ